jgi:hypothetical protein
MARHANPSRPRTRSRSPSTRSATRFALAAFVLIGAGMLAFAGAALQHALGNRAWAGYTIVIALAMLVTAGAYAAGVGGLSDLMLYRRRRRAGAAVADLDRPRRRIQPERASARRGVARARASS